LNNSTFNKRLKNKSWSRVWPSTANIRTPVKNVIRKCRQFQKYVRRFSWSVFLHDVYQSPWLYREPTKSCCAYAVEAEFRRMTSGSEKENHKQLLTRLIDSCYIYIVRKLIFVAAIVYFLSPCGGPQPAS